MTSLRIDDGLLMGGHSIVSSWYRDFYRVDLLILMMRSMILLVSLRKRVDLVVAKCESLKGLL